MITEGIWGTVGVVVEWRLGNAPFWLIVGLGVLWPASVNGQVSYTLTLRCGDTDAIEGRLRGKYEEEVVGGGINNGGNLVRLWTSGEKATWTLTITHPDGGITCFITAGEGWRKEREGKGDLKV